MENYRYLVKRLPCWFILALGVLALSAAGCNKSVPSGKVKGKVLFENQPYSDAAVTFMDQKSGRAGAAEIQANGAFQLAQPLPVGNYKVFLSPKAPAGDTTEAPKPISVDQTVPAKYWNDTTSDISVDIKTGENDVTVALKKQ